MGQACPPHMRIFSSLHAGFPCLLQICQLRKRSVTSSCVSLAETKIALSANGSAMAGWARRDAGMQAFVQWEQDSGVHSFIWSWKYRKYMFFSFLFEWNLFNLDLDSCSVSSALFLCGISFGAGWTAAARIPRTTWRAVWGEGRTWYASSREKSVTELDSFTFNLAMVVPANTAKGSVKELVP